MTEDSSVSRETTRLVEALRPAIADRLRSLSQWIAHHAYPLGFTNYATPDQVLLHGMAPAITIAAHHHPDAFATCAELGPGSGALGLAIATLAPTLHVDLADRRRKVIDYLELAIACNAVPNATALLFDAARPGSQTQWDTVCFRALAKPAEALALAAPLARARIFACHSPAVETYRLSPPGFTLLDQRPTAAPNLVLTLYEKTL